MSVGGKIVELTDEFLDQPADRLALRLTLLLVLLHGTTRTWAEIPLQALCGLMLVSRSVDRSRWLWPLLVAVLAISNAQDWFIVDNHKYLITYWALACCLSLYSRDPERLLSGTARVLIGLTFALAVMWKFLGGEFVNGNFLTFTMLADPRVSHAAAPLLGISPAQIAQNARLLAWTKLYPEPGVVLTLATSPYTHAAGLIWSYATLVVETAVAAAFLFQRPQWMARVRHDVLLAFCLLTYWLLPVAGFAFVLLVMGLVQCPADQRENRRWYVWTIIAIQFLAVPFEALGPGILGE